MDSNQFSNSATDLQSAPTLQLRRTSFKKNVCQFLFIYFISFLGERLLWKRQTIITMSSIYAVHTRIELVASERQSERFAITTMNHFFAISERFELSSFSLEDRNFPI